MPNNFVTDKATPQKVVFITQKYSEEWLADERHPEAIENFLSDSIASGWPVWRAGTKAFVFAVGTWS